VIKSSVIGRTLAGRGASPNTWEKELDAFREIRDELLKRLEFVFG